MEEIEEKKICKCHNVLNTEIIEAIESNNLKTIEEVGDETAAGTGCGFCQEEIQEILDDLSRKN
ncbi:MAG: nitrite reductase [Candidatus Cloacimonadota bacterium]|nr:MAG: nitrite reductase [Candidatus Cloacimonadota bacterium]PIE79095.1 MAG: nitrite reductase [Candidatus Delongbacteria bacterium]